MPVVIPSRASMETVNAVSWRGFVALGHQLEAEVPHPLVAEGQADQPAAVAGHEINGLGRGHLGRDDQIALVFPFLVVGEDDHSSVAKLFDRLLDGHELAGRRGARHLEPIGARSEGAQGNARSGPPQG